MVLSTGDRLKSELGWGSDPGVLPWGWGSWEGTIFTLSQISDILQFIRWTRSFCSLVHHSFYFPFVSIFFFVFCPSPPFPSFSVCLHLCPHFLAVSTFILIFCKSPHTWDWEKMRKMVTDRKQRKRQRRTENGDKDGDRQKMRIKMETDRKWGLRWRQTENEGEYGQTKNNEEDGDG